MRKTMECAMFIKSINEFRSRPILFNKLIEMHKRETPDCSCKLEYIII